MTNSRWRCGTCDRVCFGNEMLEALSPFDENDVLSACPHCKTVNDFERLCDEPGCNDYGSCGSPTPDGYRVHCGKHKP